jgi:predicted PurR-regulated permease PerM
MPDQREHVPVRTIMATIGLVLATGIALYLIVLLARIEALLIIAMFFAVVLSPPVNLLEHRLHIRRGLSTLLVFLVTLGLFGAMLYAFIRPLVDQTRHFSNVFPKYVEDARNGRGTIGKLVKRYNVDDWVKRNQKKLGASVSKSGGKAVGVARRVASGLAAFLTVVVLAILMIIYGPGILEGGLAMLSPPIRERVKPVAIDCARALTGYVFGNILISVIAGIVTFVALAIFGVPFKGVLALWVGFADLIPLVGATLGAVPTIAIAFIHSTRAGIGMLVVYIVYQQFENHVLQVAIMSRTVQINQLAVLVSVLIGVELAGLLGALLAIPAAGVLQVIARDIYDSRRGQFKKESTVGVDEVPADEVPAHEAATS